MKNHLRLILVFSFLLTQMLFCQAQATNITVDFKTTIGSHDLLLDRNYYSQALGDSVSISKLKFYISDLQLTKNKKTVAEIKNQESRHGHFLLNQDDPSSMRFELMQGNPADQITFNLGVDSLLNEQGVQDGDLDPINGMYWSWQSGYINFKMEGSSPKCNTRDKNFNLHLGGFLDPFQATIPVNIPLNIEASSSISIVLDLEKILQHIDIINQPNIMSPGKPAVDLSKVIADSFIVK